MTPGLPDLIRDITRRQPSELTRVRAAVGVAEDLAAVGDQHVSHFVGAARAAGCSWSQIGDQLGMSKQAAQQGYVAPARRWRPGRNRRPLAPQTWTDRAQRSLAAAQDEARALRHNYVGTEHLLLGVLGETESVGAVGLRRLGASAESVRAKVEDIVSRGTAAPGPGEIPFTARAKKVLDLGVREALHLGHHYVGTEHVVLGMVREGEGLAALILVELGVDLARVRPTLLEILGDRR